MKDLPNTKISTKNFTHSKFMKTFCSTSFPLQIMFLNSHMKKINKKITNLTLFSGFFSMDRI